MKKLISLDISSSTVGWALFSFSKTEFDLLDYGHIKPEKSSKGFLSYRASKYLDDISDFLIEKNPDCVAVEAYANKFPKGKSSARTIIVLSVVNETTSMASIKSIGVQPKRYPVMTNVKHFNLRYKKTGKIKDGCYDEADAIAVGLTHIIKEQKSG